jgi:acylphosphatase
MLNSPKEELRARVHGIVHGVGFRATAKKYADQLHIAGFVRNLPDGTVDICAQGDRKTLEKFLELIQQEFGPEYIRHIERAFHPIDQAHHNFSIIR